MSDDEFIDDESFMEEPQRSTTMTIGHSRHVDERLFFQTRVEVAMKVHHLSPAEAVDYVFTRINQTGIGRMDDDGLASKRQTTARRR